jgi:hypothetical protein
MSKYLSMTVALIGKVIRNLSAFVQSSVKQPLYISYFAKLFLGDAQDIEVDHLEWSTAARATNAFRDRT